MDRKFAKYTAAPNLVNICIDSRDEDGSRGRMYCCYEKDPQIFRNEYQLLMMIERMMEQIDYPQASVRMRSYRESQEEKKKRPEKLVSGEEVSKWRGGCATFLVFVQYRQRATWQGEVCWVEKEVSVPFRSVLELLKLLDSAR